MKNLFNIGKNKVKSSKGAVTLLVAVTIFTFIVILAGSFLTIRILRRSQYDSNIRIKQVYGADVDRVDEVYNEQIAKIGLNLAQKVSVGDYVAYDATNNYSYTSVKGTGSIHGSGYEGSETKDEDGNEIGQTFTSSSNIKWRVLSKNEQTGEVVLISEEPIKTDAGNNYYLNGAIGYLYAEEELNKICEIYGHGKGANIDMTISELTQKGFSYQTGDEIEGYDIGYIVGSGARSINVDDVNGICGVTPTTALDANYGTKPYTVTGYSPTKTTLDGNSTQTSSKTYTYTHYIYNGSTYLTDNTSDLYRMLFTDKYWIASRAIYITSSFIGFRIRIVDGDLLNGANWYDLTKNEYSSSIGIRPIVYLEPNILTTGQDSDGVWILK